MQRYLLLGSLLALAACSSLPEAPELAPQAAPGTTISKTATFEAGALNFDGQTAAAAGEATVEAVQGHTPGTPDRIVIRKADGTILGRTNGAGDNGHLVDFDVYKNAAWDFTAPFALYQYFSHQTGSVYRLATPTFNRGSVKLMSTNVFTPESGGSVTKSCEVDGTTSSFSAAQEGDRIFIRQGGVTGANLGRTNGAGDNATLLGLAVVKVRTGKVVGSTVENAYECVPFALARYFSNQAGQVLRVYTPRNNAGSVKLVDTVIQTPINARVSGTGTLPTTGNSFNLGNPTLTVDAQEVNGVVKGEYEITYPVGSSRFPRGGTLSGAVTCVITEYNRTTRTTSVYLIGEIKQLRFKDDLGGLWTRGQKIAIRIDDRQSGADLLNYSEGRDALGCASGELQNAANPAGLELESGGFSAYAR